MLAPDLTAFRMATGYPVAPAIATRSIAERARRAGASLVTDSAVEAIEVARSRAIGLRLSDGTAVKCDRVVVAAGPWTPSLVSGWLDRQPIRKVWGVVVSTRLTRAPGHVLEELGIDRPGQPDELFSLVSAGGESSVGSTFLDDEPDAKNRVPRLMTRAARFVPDLAGAAAIGVRACARPVAFDGRPLIGAIESVPGLFVCAGHGPWGISTGPGSARRLVDVMLGRAAEDPVFSPRRVETR
jgi:glycine oxidase